MKTLAIRFTPIFILLVSLSSCSDTTRRWVSSPYTEVARLVQLNSNMDIREIGQTLKIPPLDIYHSLEDNSTVLVYKYRLKDRKMLVENNSDRHDEDSQKSGEDYFTDERTAYVFLEDSKFKSLVTTSGSMNSSFIMVRNNTFETISREDKTWLHVNELDSTNKGVIHFLKELKQ